MATTTDRDYWVEPAGADRRGFWIFGHLLLFTIGIILLVFIVWADNAVLDVVTRGQGKVIPSSRVQIIQNLEGGIMADILVKEGQQVTRGQKIAEMGNTDSDQVKLHFEIRRMGKPIDPLKYLPPA